MNLNEMRDEAHGTALEKGWYEGGEKTPLECHMLIVSEVAEATECVRNGEPPICVKWKVGGEERVKEVTPKQIFESLDQLKSSSRLGDYLSNENNLPSVKPEGEAIELADVLIRIGDYFGRKGWDLEQAVKIKLAYNRTRSLTWSVIAR